MILPRVSNMVLPTHAQFTDLVAAAGRPVLTDFGVATGVRPQGLVYNAGIGNYSQRGYAWEDEMGTAVAQRQTVRICDGKNRDERLVSNDAVAVLPRLKHPKRLGFDTVDLDYEPVLTIKGKVAYYPQMVVGKRLAAELDTFRAHGAEPEMYYTTIARQEAGTDRIYRQLSACYHYQGHNYVYLTDAQAAAGKSEFNNGNSCQDGAAYWFTCAPIRAVKCPNGDIQLCDMLTKCPIHTQRDFDRHCQGQAKLDVDELTVFTFMNANLMHDLQLSTALVDEMVQAQLATPEDGQNRRLTTLRAGFSQDNLKTQIQTVGPQTTDSVQLER